MPQYTCKQCGKPVVVMEGEIIRACPHPTASVIASVSAVVYGEADMAYGNQKALALKNPEEKK